MKTLKPKSCLLLEEAEAYLIQTFRDCGTELKTNLNAYATRRSDRT